MNHSASGVYFTFIFGRRKEKKSGHADRRSAPPPPSPSLQTSQCGKSRRRSPRESSPPFPARCSASAGCVLCPGRSTAASSPSPSLASRGCAPPPPARRTSRACLCPPVGSTRGGGKNSVGAIRYRTNSPLLLRCERAIVTRGPCGDL